MICCGLRTGREFARALKMAIIGQLIACGDVDSDVRLQAEEYLNRTIKVHSLTPLAGVGSSSPFCLLLVFQISPFQPLPTPRILSQMRLCFQHFMDAQIMELQTSTLAFLKLVQLYAIKRDSNTLHLLGLAWPPTHLSISFFQQFFFFGFSLSFPSSFIPLARPFRCKRTGIKHRGATTCLPWIKFEQSHSARPWSSLQNWRLSQRCKLCAREQECD